MVELLRGCQSPSAVKFCGSVLLLRGTRDPEAKDESPVLSVGRGCMAFSFLGPLWIELTQTRIKLKSVGRISISFWRCLALNSV